MEKNVGIIQGDFTLSDPDINVPAKAQLESKIAEISERICTCEIPDVSAGAITNLQDLNATIIAQDKAIRELRAEAAKWERLHDELYAEIASEHRRDEYGETETAAECVKRVIRERDELCAKIEEYEQAPTVATVFGGIRGSSWEPYIRESEDVDLPPPGTELIARPARKGE